ncbi:MAG: hypothetical protein QOE84_1142 [Actinomycetota bacterium]|nr:hypothetical protein [Actinomycetota bacterium]
MSEHIDLDELADAAAGEPTKETAHHLAGCADCQSAVDEVRTAQTPVTAALAALPSPELPTDVAAAIATALAAESRATGTASVTTLPPASGSSARRWLPAAAAVLVLLAGAGYGISRLGSSDNASSTSASGAASGKDSAALNVVRNDTGADYTGRAALAAAVPDLLAGTAATQQSRSALSAPAPASAPLNAAGAQPAASAPAAAAVADPLARLRDNAGLADCLLALLPPDDPSVKPLALDYAQFKGSPALVVLLPSALPKKLDVFVVGPGCSQANDSTLFYTSVDKP